MNPFFKISILSVPIIFAGCMSTSKNTSTIEYYSLPQASSQTATIIGDLYDRKYLADTIAFVFAVDKKKVANGYQQLKEPLILQAGEHDLQIWCGQGSYNYTNLVKVHIEPNKRYQVGYELNPNKQEGCVFWINDLEAKKPVTELVNGVGLWRANPITDLPIQEFLEPRPNPSQGYTVVPIRIINKMGSH